MQNGQPRQRATVALEAPPPRMPTVRKCRHSGLPLGAAPPELPTVLAGGGVRAC